MWPGPRDKEIRDHILITNALVVAVSRRQESLPDKGIAARKRHPVTSHERASSTSTGS
jgi:hypothetical protein